MEDSKMNKFVERVMRQLPETLPDERDRHKLICDVRQLYRDGFTIQHAIKYMHCLEEVNPELNEDVALERMARIRSSYKGRE